MASNNRNRSTGNAQKRPAAAAPSSDAPSSSKAARPLEAVAVFRVHASEHNDDDVRILRLEPQHADGADGNVTALLGPLELHVHAGDELAHVREGSRLALRLPVEILKARD